MSGRSVVETIASLVIGGVALIVVAEAFRSIGSAMYRMMERHGQIKPDANRSPRLMGFGLVLLIVATVASAHWIGHFLLSLLFKLEQGGGQ